MLLGIGGEIKGGDGRRGSEGGFKVGLGQQRHVVLWYLLVFFLVTTQGRCNKQEQQNGHKQTSIQLGLVQLVETQTFLVKEEEEEEEENVSDQWAKQKRSGEIKRETSLRRTRVGRRQSQ